MSEDQPGRPDQPGPPPHGQPQYGQPQYGQPPGYPQYGQPHYGQYGQPPAPYGYGQPPGPYGYGQPPGLYGYGPDATGPIGEVRSTGLTMLLFFVTFGIYGLYWWYVTHEEMKRHSGEGLGGVVALLLAFFVGVAMPFLTSHEVGQLRARAGERERVSALTGLWYFPGIFILVGPFVWFVRTNHALNDYWRELGARG